MRKIASFLLCAVFDLALALAPVTPSLAAEVVPPKSITGTIVNETATTAEVKAADGSSVVLNISDSTYVVDSDEGNPMVLKDRKNDNVVAYYGPIETRSLPPQSNAAIIICNLPEKGFAPTYAIAEAVAKDGDSIKVTFSGGSIIATLNPSTPLKGIALDEIKEGNELLLWYEIVALSHPAQATPTKAVYLGSADELTTTAPETPQEPGAWVQISEKTVEDASGIAAGTLPVFTGTNAAAIQQLNRSVDQFFENAMSSAKDAEAEGVTFTCRVVESAPYTSVIVHGEISAGNTAGDEIKTFVLNTMTQVANEQKPYTLADLLGPNAYKLANFVIAQKIESADEGAYFTDENQFDGLKADPSFYVATNGILNIVFDKYQIAPGATGTPTFTIPLDRVVNIEVGATDLLVENGVTFAPLRTLAEEAGYTLSWNGETRGITLAKDGVTCTITIGSTEYAGKTMEAPPTLLNDRTYVPISFMETGLNICYLNEGNKVTFSAIK
jgi:hypothetical protein